MNKFLHIFIFVLLLFPSYARAAPGTTLFVSPSKLNAAVGDSITATIFVSVPNQPMNAISGTVLFPKSITIDSISTEGSIVNFWTTKPRVVGNSIEFEGIILNPGYQGTRGNIFTIKFLAKTVGTIPLTFSQGAILANDGLGTNILSSFSSATIRVSSSLASAGRQDTPDVPFPGQGESELDGKLIALPVITEYPTSVNAEGKVIIRGKGAPLQLTKLSFKDTSFKSLGEQFITALQTKKNIPTDTLLKNNENGIFEYVSSQNLLAGVYNVTPSLVDAKTDTEKPGFGVKILVNNSSIVKGLVVIINVLALLIPIVTLVMIIYFIPWYSRLRMKIMKRKIHLEEEQINLSEEEIKRKERIISGA